MIILIMENIFPLEIINYIFEYNNPYKDYFYKNIILHIKSKYTYSLVMKQLKQFCVYSKDKKFIYFAKDAILCSI